MAPKAAPAPAPTGGEAEGVRPTVESAAQEPQAGMLFALSCHWLPSALHTPQERATRWHMASHALRHTLAGGPVVVQREVRRG